MSGTRITMSNSFFAACTFLYTDGMIICLSSIHNTVSSTYDASSCAAFTRVIDVARWLINSIRLAIAPKICASALSSCASCGVLAPRLLAGPGGRLCSGGGDAKGRCSITEGGGRSPSPLRARAWLDRRDIATPVRPWLCAEGRRLALRLLAPPGSP
jgi:hypothetical protein